MRTLSFVLTLTLTLALGVSAAIASPPKGDDVLVYSWSSNVGNLNPHLYSPSQMFAQALVFEPLVRYQADGSVKPCLAESWTKSKDGKEYTFKLRKNVFFSDGTPFDAAAVKMNFDTVLKNHARHGWLELINQMQGVNDAGGKAVQVIDSHTVKLTFKDSYYPILQELALVRPVRFLSPSAFPESGDTAQGFKAPIGTGPWKVEKMLKGEYDVFTRNNTYWGAKPKMKKLVVKVIPDSSARAIAYDSGEIDLIMGAGGHGAGQLGLDVFKRYQNMDNVITEVSKPLATRALAINTNRFPTNDLSVRKAILHAVNKAALVKHIFLNVEKQADTIFSPDNPYCNIGLKPYEFDTSKTADLLEKAGWTKKEGELYRSKDGKELSIDLCFVGNDALQKSVAEVVQGDLRKAGVKVNLVGEEADSFYTRQKNGEFGLIFSDSWGAPYDPHSFCSSMRVPSHADYQAQLGLDMKEQLDKTIGDVLVTIDETERQNKYKYILGTLHEQAVYLPLTYVTAIMVHSPKLKNIEFGNTKHEIPFEKINR
ncbi:MAG: nickel ABC transporter substrate-binding protein [Desulfovibrio sp.]